MIPERQLHCLSIVIHGAVRTNAEPTCKECLQQKGYGRPQGNQLRRRSKGKIVIEAALPLVEVTNLGSPAAVTTTRAVACKALHGDTVTVGCIAVKRPNKALRLVTSQAWLCLPITAVKQGHCGKTHAWLRIN